MVMILNQDNDYPLCIALISISSIPVYIIYLVPVPLDDLVPKEFWRFEAIGLLMDPSFVPASTRYPAAHRIYPCRAEIVDM
jgi:hypothetical protein